MVIYIYIHVLHLFRNRIFIGFSSDFTQLLCPRATKSMLQATTPPLLGHRHRTGGSSTHIVTYIYIYTLSFQTLQICRVQTKTLGLAVIMLKTLGLSQKPGFSYKLSEFDIVLASNTSPTLLHHMFLRFSSIQPFRQETTSTLYIWSREKRNPNMEKYGSGIQASSKPCSTRDLPVSTRVFLRNTQGL